MPRGTTLRAKWLSRERAYICRARAEQNFSTCLCHDVAGLATSASRPVQQGEITAAFEPVAAALAKQGVVQCKASLRLAHVSSTAIAIAITG